MVLAAGFGKRLRPLTVHTAKPAFPLMGRPVIEYILRRLARAGVGEAIVNLHHHVETVTPSLERAPAELSIHRSVEAELLGTAGGLKKVECHFASEDAFLLLNADTLVDFDLDAMMRVHRDSGALATLLLRPKPSRSPYSTVDVGADGRINSIVTGGSDGEWMFAGVWVLSPKILERLSGAPCGLEKELLPGLIAERAAYACPQEPNWITIDTPQPVLGRVPDDGPRATLRRRLERESWYRITNRPRCGPAPGLASNRVSTFTAMSFWVRGVTASLAAPTSSVPFAGTRWTFPKARDLRTA